MNGTPLSLNAAPYSASHQAYDLFGALSSGGVAAGFHGQIRANIESTLVGISVFGTASVTILVGRVFLPNRSDRNDQRIAPDGSLNSA
jgi:hypothetical protein